MSATTGTDFFISGILDIPAGVARNGFNDTVDFFISSPPMYNNIRPMDEISIGVTDNKINGVIRAEGRRR